MVEIVGHDPSVARTVSCKGCGSRLAYYKRDVITYSSTDYGGGTDRYHYIKCPGCTEEISVKAWY